MSGIGYEAYEEDILPQILTANYYWEMGHRRIVGLNIPREEKSFGMQWVTKGVMFLRFKTRADAEVFKEKVHGIEIMSGTGHRDHLRDLRVTWAHHEMDTFDCRSQLHPKRPRYFGDVWKFLPKELQGSDSAYSQWEVDV